MPSNPNPPPFFMAACDPPFFPFKPALGVSKYSSLVSGGQSGVGQESTPGLPGQRYTRQSFISTSVDSGWRPSEQDGGGGQVRGVVVGGVVVVEGGVVVVVRMCGRLVGGRQCFSSSEQSYKVIKCHSTYKKPLKSKVKIIKYHESVAPS